MKRESMPKVSILILNFNGKRLLCECLSSLSQNSYPNAEVIVIDNGSTDDTTTFVAENFPDARLIRFDENKGFCEAYNLASKIVESDLLLFLNNDITVANRDWLCNMVNTILGDPKIGAVGAKQLISGRGRTIENLGGSLMKWQGGLRIGFGEEDENQYDMISDPFYVSGSALLIRRNVFVQTGSFDSEMFAYSEDLDLCWRLRLMGYEIKTCPQAILFHKSSASFKRKINSLYLQNRNFIRTSIKNYSMTNLLKNLPPLLTASVLFGLSATALSRNGCFLRAILKSISHNVLELNSTVKARLSTQNKRRVSDDEVFASAQVGRIEKIATVVQKAKSFS